MGNDMNKNSRVPPGASQPVRQDQPRIKPDGERVCACCHDIGVDLERWIALLQSCEFCATNCDGEPCQKNKCKCPGDCCAEHKAGEKCNDTAAFILGKIGGALLEVCVACTAEIAKKALLP